MRKLTDHELDLVSDLAVETVEKFIFSRVSKKEILDIHIKAEVTYEDGLTVDILVDLDLDELSQVKEKELVEDAVDAALKTLDKFIEENFN
ncbi:MAG: DUF3194 domain-containing protein [Methanothermobacter sp.]